MTTITKCKKTETQIQAERIATLIDGLEADQITSENILRSACGNISDWAEAGEMVEIYLVANGIREELAETSTYIETLEFIRLLVVTYLK